MAARWAGEIRLSHGVICIIIMKDVYRVYLQRIVVQETELGLLHLPANAKKSTMINSQLNDAIIALIDQSHWREAPLYPRLKDAREPLRVLDLFAGVWLLLLFVC